MWRFANCGNCTEISRLNEENIIFTCAAFYELSAINRRFSKNSKLTCQKTGSVRTGSDFFLTCLFI
jgi:hypothetical protein